MKRLIFGLLAVASLVGCATQRLNSGLQAAIGQPVQMLVSDWGYPDSQRKIMGTTLYVWSNDAGAMAVPLYGGGVFAGRLTCTVQVAVDGNGLIRSFQWSGNNGGCAAFARRLP